LRIARTIGHLSTGAFSFSEGRFGRFSIKDLIMNLRTKLAITGVGVAVLMLLAFLTPVDAMAQIG
jgi:hypothetical protein